jgi:hypothetical protein
MSRTKPPFHRLLAAGPLAALAATIALMALPGSAAASLGNYTINAGSGAPFSLLTAHNLVSGAADDVLYYLSTTGSGPQNLPFPIKAYNHTYHNIAVSTNGNVQLGVVSPKGTTAYNNDCLPTAAFPTATIMPFWDDLAFDSNDTAHGFTEGVFRQTQGKAPHRTFTISWQGHEFTISNSNPLVFAEVIFTEGSQKITFVYGLNGGTGATVGVQSAQQQTSAPWSCNSPTGVTSGQTLTFVHSG